jgi:hypothetical protein
MHLHPRSNGQSIPSTQIIHFDDALSCSSNKIRTVYADQERVAFILGELYRLLYSALNKNSTT